MHASSSFKMQFNEVPVEVLFIRCIWVHTYAESLFEIQYILTHCCSMSILSLTVAKKLFQRTSGILPREKQRCTSENKEAWQQDSFKLSTLICRYSLDSQDWPYSREYSVKICSGLKRKSNNNSSLVYENEASVFRNCLSIQIDLLVSAVHFWTFLMRNGSRFMALKIRKTCKGF